MSDNTGGNAPQQWQSPYSGFENLMVNLAHFLSLPTQVLFRKKFGKRHLRVFHTNFLSFTIYVLWVGTFALAPLMLGNKALILSWFYLLIVTILASIHAIEIYLRPKRGVKIHSRYTGFSRVLDFIPGAVKAKFKEWEINLEIFVKMYVETALCFLVAWLIFPIDPVLSMLFGVGGASLYLSGQYKAARDEDKLLDIIDGQIESGILQQDLTLNTGDVENFGLESYTPKTRVVSSRTKPVKRELEDEDGKMPQLPLELRNLVNEDEEEDDEPATVRPTATVKIGVVPSRKEENGFDPMTATRPRGRPRKETGSVYP